MTKYQSNIKTISSSEEVVFDLLSDLNNLEKLSANELAVNNLKVLEYDRDSCLLEIHQIGKVGLKIIERESFKTIKFVTFELPFEVNLWVQLKEVDVHNTKMKLTFAAELPSMIKMMFSSKMESGINSLADFLAEAINTQLNK